MQTGWMDDFAAMLLRLLLMTLATACIAQETGRLDVLVSALGKIGEPATQASILKGMRESLQGQRGIPEPKGWPEVYAKLKESPDESVREQAQALAVIFGGGAALGEMRARLLDDTAPAEQRRQALDSLVAQRDPAALDGLLKLAVQAGPLREPAIRGLAGFDDPRIAPALVDAFAILSTPERLAAIQTLLARAAGAKAFVAAVDAGKIAKAELTAPLARQIDGLKDAELSAWLARNWGAVSAPNEDKQKQIEKFKAFTSTEAILRADANHGRALFAQACAVCHTMFGTGGKLGPDLTGGYEDTDYLLSNILDPNALIGKDYQQTFVKTKDGRTVAGIVTLDTDSAISLKTLTGDVITVQKPEVASTELSPLSMMPEGLLATMDEESVRDLFLYLRQKQQVPMLVTAVNANDFFSGTDLRNWRATGNSWNVEDGGLVARGTANVESLTSEMVAGAYKLTAQVKVTGGKAAAEFVLAGGRNGETFHGITLSLGGPSAANLWTYAGGEPAKLAGRRALHDATWHALEITRTDGKISVALDGKLEFETDDPQPRRHTAPALWLQGEGAELRVKEMKIKPL